MEFRDPSLLCNEPFEGIKYTEQSSTSEDDPTENYLFQIILQESKTLSFSCRGRSMNLLTEDEMNELEDDGDEEEAVDPNFFDSGYTLAGRTGFQIWAGSRLLLETLLRRSNWNLSGIRVLELGAGVGVVGTTLAAGAEAQVVMTDLSTLVDHTTRPNAERNADFTPGRARSSENDTKSTAPSWMSKFAPLSLSRGWVGTTAVDWTKPLPWSNDCEFDYVVASDCVWLTSMMTSLLNTVEAVFALARSKPIRFVMSFQRRESSSGMFTNLEAVVDAIHSRSWELECLAWRTEPAEVFVLEIIPHS